MKIISLNGGSGLLARTKQVRKNLNCGCRCGLTASELAIAALVFLVTAPIAAATTYYLDGNNGNDGNPGTSELPWRTIARAMPAYSAGGAKVMAGDTVRIRDGFYGAFSDLTQQANSDWINYVAEEGHAPQFGIINLRGTSGSARTSYKYILDGLKIRYDGSALNFIYINDVKVRNCDIAAGVAVSDQRLVRLRSAANVAIEHCRIHHGKRGVSLEAMTGDAGAGPTFRVVLKNNEFYYLAEDGIQGGAGCRHITIQGNLFHHINPNLFYPPGHGVHSDVIQFGPSDGVDAMHDIVIRGNKCSDISHVMIVDGSGQSYNWTIENNLFENSATVVNFAGVTDAGQGVVVRHNTFVGGGSARFYCPLRVVANNVIYDLADSAATITGSHTRNLCGPKSNLNSAGSPDDMILSEAAFNAIFADAANGDYTPAENSLAIGYADPAFATDIDMEGNLRDEAPDAGCYEYNGASQGQYVLNIAINGHGTVTKEPDTPTYVSGTEVTLSAQPGPGYEFYSWSGDLSGATGTTVTIVMDSNKSVTANFVESGTGGGLVAYWKFDELSGAIATDASGTNNTAALLNGTSWAEGRFNGAVRFDGADDAVQIGTTAWTAGQGTVSLWAYAENFSNYKHFLFGHATQPWSNRIQLYTDASGNLNLGLGNSSALRKNIQPLETYKWYHLVLTWNGAGFVVYVDGIAKASGTYSGLSTLNHYADIGNNGNSAVRIEAFDGSIDDVRIYNRALSQGEIFELTIPLFAPIGDKFVDENSLLTFTVQTADPAVAVSAEPLPSGALFASETFTWTPSFEQAGLYDVSFTATDGEIEDFELITITVSNVNRAPVLEPIGNKSVEENALLTFVVSATDPDGDPVSYLAWALPSGAALSDNVFTWVPSSGQAGTYQVTFSVNDGNLDDAETITITVSNVNEAPVLESIGDKSIDENSLLSFSVSATDPDGDAVVCSASGLPDGAVFSNSVFSWTPSFNQAGIYEVVFTASDGQLQDFETITITVSDVPSGNTDGLVGHWKFDETSGLAASDSSGTGNMATLVNGPTWSTGRINGGLSFDGLNDAAEVGTINWDAGWGTIAMWVYAQEFSNYKHFLFGHATQPWSNRIQLYTDANGNLCLGLGDTSKRRTNITQLTVGRWYHIALTYDGVQYVVYLDGAAKASGSYTGLSGLNGYADIGNNGNSSTRTEAFAGVIDDVRIYNRPLSAGEVLDLVTGEAPINQPPVLAPIGDRSVDEDALLAFTVTASDPDGDEVVIWAEGLPAGASFDGSTFLWTPQAGQTGVYPVSFFASDGQLEDSESISIFVNGSADGLVLDIRFDSDPADGVFDSSPYQNEVTSFGGPTAADGVIGGGCQLDGYNDYLRINDRPEFSGGHDLTVCLWFKAEVLNGGLVPLVTKYRDSSNKDWGLSIAKGRMFFGYENQKNNWDTKIGLSGKTSLSVGQWYCAAFTYTNATRTVRLYLDGAQEGSIVLPTFTPDTSAAVEIGRDGYKRDYLGGLVDEVKIYDRVLSDSEILALP